MDYTENYAYSAMKLKKGASTCCCNCRTEVDDVSVHGLHQLFNSDSRCMRYFWLCVLLASVTLLFYEVHQIVEHYRSYPKATRVTWVTSDQYDYPDLAFSTKRWINLQKVEEFNLTNNALLFLISMIEHDIVVDEEYSEKKAEKEVQQIMVANNFSNYLQLLKAIAFEGRDILRHMGPQPLRIETFVPYMWMSYRLTYPKINATMLRYQIRLNFEYATPSPNTTWIFDWETPPLLVIRESAGVKMDPVIFARNGTYRIYVDFQVYKRISTANKPCLKANQLPQDYYIQFCEQMCVDQSLNEANCSRCAALSILDAFENKNSKLNTPPCHYLVFKNGSKLGDSRKEQHCAVREEETFRECTRGPKKCLPECDEKKYQHSTTMISTKPADKLEIWLTLNPFDGILTLEEVPTYTFDTFVSNVGGQLGLWLGASVISVIQTLLCFVSFVCGNNRVKNKGDKKDGSSSAAEGIIVLKNRDVDKDYAKNGGKRCNAGDENEASENRTILTLWPPVELNYVEDPSNTV